MAITTRDGLIAAQATAQRMRIMKTATRTAVAATPFSVFDLAGDPGAGVLAGTSVAAGVVPTDATAGVPVINAFGGGATGYVTRVEASWAVSGRLAIYDLLWQGGAYPFNATQTLAAQPSYSGRLPGGDYKGTEIWLQCVTAFTGNQSVAITYTADGGATGHTTGKVATGVAPIVGRMFKMPFASGDTGVQKIESVTGTVATAGTFNVLVMRKLWEGRIRAANDQIVHGFDLTGMPVVFADSALVLVATPDSTATSTPEVVIDIANG